ncbi:MAG: protein-export membrane protein SecF [Candidatus Harrisonbacteria bacterium RIFCSPHIGHO2_01_FULL_44_13]|uniref:Protein-export membrane protein SecF n=1 Tax=Candidatus Harrisonbacteria bacterium RIFCSPLOWO2_01_FULL_44_18 TaxID=1798407 RepID=A0A1G1ZLX7_9BACT|nr:MAG: protein-export membrane protein SecF [Candidatus Harrisonbacteria bacterium RIFCSPHIGHO2_01_FULL_44_13]OGY65551.1 MAG: protein-export membrane protein SecF [Candidatus Harrisonbacteria bacterium RIFCSPLOWO2_01_FULL_44_18]
MDIIKYKYIFLTFSGVLVLASIVSIAVFGLKQGIDLAGGTLWQIKIVEKEIDNQELKGILQTKVGATDPIVTRETSSNSFLIRVKEISEQDHQKYLDVLKQELGQIEELRFESIGSSIGNELRRRAIWAFILVLTGISAYVAFAFRKVSYPVKSWKYGIITLVTLFHDAVIPVGLYAFLGWFRGAEVDTNFIVALLVIIGFSVHDTIVVFDRIREKLKLASAAKSDFNTLVNQGVNETIARSVNTSLTLIFVLVALYFFGPTALSYFILMILTGTIVGTYSSIFVASPLLTLWRR